MGRGAQAHAVEPALSLLLFQGSSWHQKAPEPRSSLGNQLIHLQSRARDTGMEKERVEAEGGGAVTGIDTQTPLMLAEDRRPASTVSAAPRTLLSAV